MSDKIKILLLAANSVDTADPRASDEIRAIDRAIYSATFREKFDIQKEPALRVSDIGSLLLKHNPDVLHIGGHSKRTEGLVLENEHGEVAKVQCDQLVEVLLRAGSNLRLVFLAFCHSAECAKALSSRVDYVLGVKGEIQGESSLLFAPAFYEALASGKSVQDAFAYGKSLMGLNKLPGDDVLVLEVRSGADATAPFFRPDAVVSELKSAMGRVIQGIGSEMDRSNLRRAIDVGVLVISQSEAEDKENREGDLAVRFKENAGILRATLAPDAYRRARETVYPVPPGIAPPLPPSVFIGREDALQDVKRLLAVKPRTPGEENVTIIRGWPGVGKTSLVGAIGHDAELAQTFKDGVLWTSLEQKPNVISEMARWGRALGSDEILRAPTVKDAIAQLGALLSRRRMLLIVDDVWETAHAAAFTEAAGEHCSVMITTRLPKVAEALTTIPERIYNLPVLTEEFALKLLEILAPEVAGQNESECRELVRDLECLPLALHVAAGLLRSEAKLGWGVTDLIEKIRQGTELITREAAPKDRIEKDGVIPSVSALLQRSTDVLDAQTRDCFAYLGAFAPKPATFDLPAMQAVWEVDDPKPIVRTLVGHGLLEPVGRGRFQMHRILVEHARSLCSD